MKHIISRDAGEERRGRKEAWEPEMGEGRKQAAGSPQPGARASSSSVPSEVPGPAACCGPHTVVSTSLVFSISHRAWQRTGVK